MIEKKFNFLEGEFLLIDKPFQWTSFQVVHKVRGLIRKKIKTDIKVGHAGTLDPLATGLLIICTGKFTKKIDEYQGMQKEYTGTFNLGATTPSFDMETSIDKTFETAHITKELINKTAQSFIGKSMQIAPAFSAKKINGERAYEKARRGERVEIKPREVEIDNFIITGIKIPEVHFKLQCSKGTYVRSIANDFGARLNSGAYLSSLCRTAIGKYNLKDAMKLEAFEQLVFQE